MDAKPRYWEKIWHDLLKDREVGVLPDNLKWRFVSCILLAGVENNGGWLPPIDEMAFELRIPEAQLALELPVLAQRGLLEIKVRPSGGERWFVTNWAKRQAPSSNKDRVQAFRVRQREVKRECNEDVTNSLHISLHPKLSTGNGHLSTGCNENVTDVTEDVTKSLRCSAASASYISSSDLEENDPKAAAEAEDVTEPVTNSLQVAHWLGLAGIGGNSKRFQQLLRAGLDWRYIRAHVLERLANPDKVSTGLLITRLLNGDPEPAPRCPACYGRLESGEYCRIHGYISDEEQVDGDEETPDGQETNQDTFVF